MSSPYALFPSSAAAPLTPPFSPAADGGRDHLVRRTASRLSLDSVETFTLDDSDASSGDEDDDDDEREPHAGGGLPSLLQVVEEAEVDLAREKGIGGKAKLRVAIVTGACRPSLGCLAERLELTLELLSWAAQRTSCLRWTA